MKFIDTLKYFENTQLKVFNCPKEKDNSNVNKLGKFIFAGNMKMILIYVNSCKNVM